MSAGRMKQIDMIRLRHRDPNPESVGLSNCSLATVLSRDPNAASALEGHSGLLDCDAVVSGRQ